MPELPDVEGFRREARKAAGRRIERVELIDPTLLRGGRADSVGGRRFGDPQRHGKWLIMPAGAAEVLMHFGMTGRLDWARHGSERHRHDRIVFVCRGGELRYRNMRKFGGIWVWRRRRELVTGPLGPDATEVDRDRFRALVGGRRGTVKHTLMDQAVIAGLGNLMVDETAWRARVDPRRKVGELSPRRLDRLWSAMDEVVRESLPTGRVPPVEGWLTGARDAREPRCPRCGGRLRRQTVAGRPTVWCPRCQR